MSVRSPWEDPHPGERFSIPFEAPGWTGRDNKISGKFMDGVAAKAECTRKNDQIGMVHRSPRMRRGNSFPKPLMIPSKVPEEIEAKSAPVPEQTYDIASRSPSRSPSFPFPVSNQPFELDTDSETAVATEASTSETATTNEPDPDPESDDAESPSIQQDCTDFSNYLGISLKAETETDIAPVSVVDSDSVTRVSSVEDAYGWEAELDRKIKCEVASAQALCPYQCARRTIASKHSLLHRVFTMHSSRRINSRS